MTLIGMDHLVIVPHQVGILLVAVVVTPQVIIDLGHHIVAVLRTLPIVIQNHLVEVGKYGTTTT